MNARIHLPAPRYTEGLGALLMARRSMRDYDDQPLAVPDLAHLLWAGQGITHSSGKHTAPSPHGLHPLTLYLVAGRVAGVETGLYAYEPRTSILNAVSRGDPRDELYQASFEDQPWVRDCAALIVVAGDVQRAISAFADQPPAGERGRRYIHIEAGGVAQNIALQAAELQLGCVLVGGFDDQTVKQCLGLQTEPLILLPLGHAA